MNLIFKFITFLLFTSTCSFAQMDDCVTEETQGYEMLLIGNSFFRPYAEKLNTMAVEAGFVNHSGTTVFRGGENGRPINFWQDSTSSEHLEIKATLDQGNIQYFGMTAGLIPNNPTDGFREWIEYALISNPDVTIFLSIPPFDFPNNWDQLAADNGFETIQELYYYFVNEIIHKTIVDPLRSEFPSTKIFTIPTGWATFNLYQKNLDNELLDEIEMFGPRETSIFTDNKGHQGDIIRETGGMVWLNSIYNVDLNSFDYDTGFDTDLRSVANEIVSAHDTDYSLCFDQKDSPEVSCDSTYAVIIEEDITYAEGLAHDIASSSIVPMPQKLDLYYPDNNSTNRPVYMFIHGGGFQGGTKTKPEIINMAHYFASRGWVFVSVDYRTASDFPGNVFTGIAPQEWIDFSQQNATAPGDVRTSVAMYAAQRDNKAALRWIVSNASTYNVNTDFITVGGASAGAITTIALGVSNQEDFRDEIPLTEDPTLSTTNLNETYEVRSLVDFWGGNVKLDLFESIYDINRFDSEDPELFIAHGTEDPTVLFSEAEDMVQLYDSTGVYVELYPLEGQGHGAWNAQVGGKSLSELSFDFLVERQELILEDGCDLMTSTYETAEIDVHIFPNPTSNFINIHVDGAINYSASLYDINGRIINTDQNVSKLNTMSLKSGIYILKIIDIDTGGEIMKKIVIER